MSHIKSLIKALEYIENSLTVDIDLSTVAKEAGYSLYHFQRIFQGAIGDSVRDYITKRRITEAAKELYNTDIPTIDIGLKYGYQSREAFSRAFTRVFGRNPSEVRKEDLLYFIRKPMTYEYLMFEYQRRKNGMVPTIKTLPERSVVGKKWHVFTDGTNLQDIPLYWHTWYCNKEWEYIKYRKSPNECLGICLFSNSSSFEYMIGYEVTVPMDVPNDMVVEKLKPGLYAVFHTIGPVTESVQKGWQYIYGTWLPESGYQHAGNHDIELYYELQSQVVTDLYLPIKQQKS